jgi:hypothetical protein
VEDPPFRSGSEWGWTGDARSTNRSVTVAAL